MLEHITNLNITFNQIETNKEMNTTDADDDEVDCEKELVADDDNNDDDEVDSILQHGHRVLRILAQHFRL